MLKTLFAATAFLFMMASTTLARSPEFGTVYIGAAYLSGSTSGAQVGSTAEPLIRVAHDGNRWSTILNTEVEIGFVFNASMDKGYVIDVFFGRGAQRGGDEVDDRYEIANSDSLGKDFHAGVRRIGTSSVGRVIAWNGDSSLVLSAVGYKEKSKAFVKQIDIDGIIAACNNHSFSEDTEHTTSYSIPISMQVDGRSRKDSRGEIASHRGRLKRKLVSALLPVRVECEAPPSMIQAPPEPYSVDLRVTQQGETCPKKVEVRAFIRYRQPATAQFRFKVDGKLSELHEIRARKLRTQQGVPGETYLVERVKYYHLDPRRHIFRIEVRGGKKSKVKTLRINCPPFAVTDMWMSVKQQNKATCPKNVTLRVLVNANRPGSVLTRIKNQAGVVMAIESIKVKRKGDHYEGVWTSKRNMREIDTQLIAEDSNDTSHNSGWQPLKITCLKPIKGTLTLQDPEAPKCPRKGRIAMAIQTTTPGKVPYRLVCSRGWRWSGKLKAHETAPGTYLGVGVKSFKIKKGVHINCALKTKVDGNWVVAALQGRKYQCIGRNDNGGSGDIGTSVDPTHDGSNPEPPVIVDCARGYKRVRGRCVRICPRGQKLVNGRCIRRIVECRRGYRKASGKCVRIECPRSQKLVGNRCIRRVVECLRGFRKVGERCVRITCPRRQKLLNGRCKRIVVCSRGFKKVGQRCVRISCPRGQRLVRGRCKRIVVDCRRGFRKVGQRCVRISCPRGRRLVRGRCKRIACPTGYTRVRGKCLKPAG